jgi:hypothetical protein
MASTPTGAVFLSYASQDAWAAQRIYEALRAAGIEVWFDQSELRGGDAWDHVKGLLSPRSSHRRPRAAVIETASARTPKTHKQRRIAIIGTQRIRGPHDSQAPAVPTKSQVSQCRN